jgi:hypothetical protein
MTLNIEGDFIHPFHESMKKYIYIYIYIYTHTHIHIYIYYRDSVELEVRCAHSS